MAQAKDSKNKEKTAGEIMQYAIGRRKRAVARVRMYQGSGETTINDKLVRELVPSNANLKEFEKPLALAGMTDSHYFSAKVTGGGSVSQLEAVRLGIARCIAKINEDLKHSMRSQGFLTRDPREKERKKVYHIGARKGPQFSKR